VVRRLTVLRRRGSRRVARWAGIALEALGELGHVWRPQRHDDFGRGSGRPVVLLHGYGAPRRILHVMEHRLRKNLGVSVVSFHLPGLGGVVDATDLETEASRVACKIERLCERRGVAEIDMVGHSRGGVLARHIVASHPVGRRVRTLVTLGSPFLGSPVAVLGAIPLGFFSRSLWQLMPFSPFLRRLNRLPLPPGLRFVSIAGGADVTAPWFLCRVPLAGAAPGTVHNYVVSATSHNGLLVSRRVFTLVAAELCRPVETPRDGNRV
jgi:pimeloyl-ACP methyl ester carboxylesterase